MGVWVYIQPLILKGTEAMSFSMTFGCATIWNFDRHKNTYSGHIPFKWINISWEHLNGLICRKF